MAAKVFGVCEVVSGSKQCPEGKGINRIVYAVLGDVLARLIFRQFFEIA